MTCLRRLRMEVNASQRRWKEQDHILSGGYTHNGVNARLGSSRLPLILSQIDRAGEGSSSQGEKIDGKN